VANTLTGSLPPEFIYQGGNKMQKRYISIKDPAAQADKIVFTSILVIFVLLEILVPWVQS